MRPRLAFFLVAVLLLPGCLVYDNLNEDDGPARPDIDLTTLSDCPEIENAFAAETEYVTYCTRDSDCGQVLTGTSCGCTRDWVARLGVDTDRFYALIDLASENQCALPFSSPCDCPHTDGFACVNNRCNWNFVRGS